MVVTVHCQNRHLYQRELDAMHRDRKTVFIDMSGWDLKATDDREYDQYDTDQAVYLIEADPSTGEHLASLRLLPTTGPHLLADIFPELCDGEPPRSDDVWEVTRVCFKPAMRGRERRDMLKHLTIASAEFGLRYGISRLSMMVYLSFLPEVLSLGWESEPLGEPKVVDGREAISAFTVTVNAEALERFRSQWGVPHPVIELASLRAA